MSQTVLFEASVPVLSRYLAGLQRVLGQVQALDQTRAEQVLQARLAADMLPFSAQVETAAYLALRTALPLAARAVPPFAPSAVAVQALTERVNEVLAVLSTLRPVDFSGDETRLIKEQAGHAPIELPAKQFLFEFAMPNFLFHICMAYAIARAEGVAVGKQDYDGFHRY